MGASKHPAIPIQTFGDMTRNDAILGRSQRRSQHGRQAAAPRMPWQPFDAPPLFPTPPHTGPFNCAPHLIRTNLPVVHLPNSAQLLKLQRPQLSFGISLPDVYKRNKTYYKRNFDERHQTFQGICIFGERGCLQVIGRHCWRWPVGLVAWIDARQQGYQRNTRRYGLRTRYQTSSNPLRFYGRS